MGMLQMLFLTWGVITAVMICVMIYRSALENREEDQIFLDAAGERTASEQRVLVDRIEKLGRPIVALMVVSGVLLAVIAGLWLYQGFKSF